MPLIPALGRQRWDYLGYIVRLSPLPPANKRKEKKGQRTQQKSRQRIEIGKWSVK
jgi:hypothetical protein